MAVKTTRYRRHMVASGSFGCSWAATKWTRTVFHIIRLPVGMRLANVDHTFQTAHKHAKKVPTIPQLVRLP